MLVLFQDAASKLLRGAGPTVLFAVPSMAKDTSLVSQITVTELMLVTKELISTTFRPLPLYLDAAAIYWGLSLLFEGAQRRLERRFERASTTVGPENKRASLS
ncbi:hypothetical protein [Massilia sp. 9096]|uniref:hypothetical protein n=1 Tax=Massilia sp. 9096 TaxID=1500894 RepID=UPI00068F093B|nr:hypothetical protein [Massilia sp. 9096]